MGSENLTGADNQQERLDANPDRESSETICRTLPEGGEDMVRSAWRHAEPGRNVLAHKHHFKACLSVTTMSVPIRCSRRKSEEGCP